MTDIEQQLRHHLVADGLISADTIWQAQTGGRTNKVWRLTGASDLICKLYLDASANPLYANTPQAEYACLRVLAGTGVAPDAYGFVQTPFGVVLLYHYIAGHVWDGDVLAVANLLDRVHALVPSIGLRVLPDDTSFVTAQGLDILGKIKGACGDQLRALCPDVTLDPIAPVLIHTDVVAGNLIHGADGLRLIDWQCPALGDPLVDVAMFLSPAMHFIYGTAPLSDADKTAFLDAISPTIRARYDHAGGLYHWRMAAYCLWRSEQGIADYEDAALLEMALLK